MKFTVKVRRTYVKYEDIEVDAASRMDAFCQAHKLLGEQCDKWVRISDPLLEYVGFVVSVSPDEQQAKR